MKTLYITDLDGTFMGDDARVSPVSAAIVSDLSHRGALISVATARTPATVVPLMADTYTTAEMVVMTGAATWNRPGRRYGHIITIPEAEVPEVVAGFEGSGISPMVYTLAPAGDVLDVYHAAPALTAPEAHFVAERQGLGLKYFHLHSPLPAERHGATVLTFAMGPRDAITSVARRLKATTTCYVSYYKDTYTPGLWLLEIFAAGVSKATGVTRLAKSLGAERIVAFGDNLNDIPMLGAADVAVAVDNALPEVKDAADTVIGPNTADSVARFIQDDFLKNS